LKEIVEQQIQSAELQENNKEKDGGKEKERETDKLKKEEEELICSDS